MNTQINITENGTTTLATAGKYCDRNIDVNVEVQSGFLNDADKVVDGTISGDYVSDKVTSVRQYGFDKCANLTSVSLQNCININAGAFRGCTALKNANLPSCETFSGGSNFDGTETLQSINIQNLTTMASGKRIFTNCRELEEFNAPNLVSVGESTANMFNTCLELKKVYFPKLGGTVIGASSFYKCSRLVTLVLGGNELNTLENTAAFSGSAIANGTGYIYVPDNLVDTYKTATNWSAYADQIKPISELEE